MGISINLRQKEGADYVEYSGPIDAEAEVHLEQLKEKDYDKNELSVKNAVDVRASLTEERLKETSGLDQRRTQMNQSITTQKLSESSEEREPPNDYLSNG